MMDDEAIRKLLTRLSRQQRSGESTIERAAILAEGADSESIVAWIEAHDGQPEAMAVAGSASGGLHGGRLHGTRPTPSSTPQRYVLPPGVLSKP
jgi:hypothetical protein